jgi:hypothetical protein
MRRGLPKLLLALILCAVALMPARSTAPAAAVDSSALAKLPNEVKLRKLHLVRPDLIGYPLFFEVYC